MKENHVLASCLKSRKAWEKINEHVKRDDLSEQGFIVWEQISKYYDRDGKAESVDPELLRDAVTATVTADKHKQLFAAIVGGLAEHDASPENVVSDLLRTQRAAVGDRIAAAMLGTDNDEERAKLLEEYSELSDKEDYDSDADTQQVEIGRSVIELVNDSFTGENLVEVSPTSLNKRLEGGLKPGHHIVLFARPEMGKTMMTIEMMAGFLDQGLTVLYIGNEDPIDDINMRVVNRLSGMTKYEVLEKPQEADRKVRDKGYENLILYSAAPGTARQITKLVDTYKPHIMVIDQLRNLNMKQDNFVLKLEQAATKAREWAKKHGMIVVSVTQAGDSASDKAVLDLGDVDYSNTGIPAQADVMIGLGATANNAARGEVVVSLPKNKVSGRHEYFTLKTNPQLSKLESLD